MSCFRKIFLWVFCGGRACLGGGRSLAQVVIWELRQWVGLDGRSLLPLGVAVGTRPAQKTHKKNKKIKLYLVIRERAKSERLTLPELGDRFWRSWGRVLVHFEAWSPGGGSGWSDWPDPQSRRYSQGTGRFLSEAES